VLDHLWHLGIDQALKRPLAGRKLDPRGARVVFALVANRALEPLSKLAGAQWVRERVFIPGLPEVEEDSYYLAMGFLLGGEEELAKAVYFSTAELLDLSVDPSPSPCRFIPALPLPPDPQVPVTLAGLSEVEGARRRFRRCGGPLGKSVELGGDDEQASSLIYDPSWRMPVN
jgi:hypothetical protein